MSHMTEETKAKIAQVNEMKAQGISVIRACKETGLSTTLYYYHKRMGRIQKLRAAQEKRKLQALPALPIIEEHVGKPLTEIELLKRYTELKEKLASVKQQILNQLQDHP